MTERKIHTLTLPIAHGQYAELTAFWPLTDVEWNRLMAIFDAMKFGLVEPTTEPAPESVPEVFGCGVPPGFEIEPWDDEESAPGGDEA